MGRAMIMGQRGQFIFHSAHLGFTSRLLFDSLASIFISRFYLILYILPSHGKYSPPVASTGNGTSIWIRGSSSNTRKSPHLCHAIRKPEILVGPAKKSQQTRVVIPNLSMHLLFCLLITSSEPAWHHRPCFPDSHSPRRPSLRLTQSCCLIVYVTRSLGESLGLSVARDAHKLPRLDALNVYKCRLYGRLSMHPCRARASRIRPVQLVSSSVGQLNRTA
ncbi:unnamed protein product [Protopolystoma xenopodis]|uniref:Uncharacterized protein n=1 Tax=Protopolystoma xenopodis TaxID=117903 RepID=A0A448WY00_9PLAT|nr:unnamed protein product [Protopolystoma xenopodis]